MLLGALLCWPANPAFIRPAAAAEIAGTASVIDGDTIEIRGQRIRLEGIDAPEHDQICTAQDGSPVRCRGDGLDRYGRVLATCYRGGTDLNGLMVLEGHALAYRRYSTRYVGEEEAARRAGRGIWSGSFIEPWRWRRGER